MPCIADTQTRDCPAEDLMDGKVFITGNTPGSITHYMCQDNYVLDGNQVRQCLPDGTWSGDTPKCICKTNCL